MTASIASPKRPLRRWHSATWNDYLAYRDNLTLDRARLFFNQGLLWIEMGGEGINHAIFSDLFTMLFAFWFRQKPGQTATSLGRCQLEKPTVKAAAPDLVLYLGEGVPQWRSSESRYINLDQWRVPDLVGEISDTTLADDLDEKKQLYAALGIPEYWVINVQGKQVFAFHLNEGKYEQIDRSIALPNLPISLLEQTLEQLESESNIHAALWFAEAIASKP